VPSSRTARTLRAAAFARLLGAYGVAIAVALGVGFLLRAEPVLLVAALADLAATLAIFAFSVAHDNSSFYDPYWSVAPIALGGYYALAPCPPCALGADPARALLVVLLVCVWGVRLTWNFARGWRGLGHEDWRYADMRKRVGRGYWPVSLLAFHLMPTAMVFGGCLSIYVALRPGARPAGWVDLVAFAITLGAVAFEWLADRQLHRFARSYPPAGATLETGLWALCRHPNYFGEILFWWGLALFALAADRGAWWVLAGPAAITLLFLFASLPLIERRMLARRPGYAERQRRISLLIPWFPRQP
jgi:steroid 5-alpha reductase family enzyme